MSNDTPDISTLPKQKAAFRKLAIKLASDATQKIIVGVVVFVAVPLIGVPLLAALQKDENEAS
jgi:hypothetical protein